MQIHLIEMEGNYHIIGTLKPEVFNASKVEERISQICKKYNIPYGFHDNGSTNRYLNPISRFMENRNCNPRRSQSTLRIIANNGIRIAKE